MNSTKNTCAQDEGEEMIMGRGHRTMHSRTNAPCVVETGVAADSTTLEPQLRPTRKHSARTTQHRTTDVELAWS